MKRIGWLVSILAVIGLLNAGYLLWQHYAPSGSAFCNISPTLSCDVVNKSTFAEILGFPVSGLGLLGNAFFLALGITLTRPSRDPRIAFLLLASAIPAMGFSLYLTGVEAFLLGVYCPLCLLSQVQVTTILGLASAAAIKEWRILHAPQTTA